MDNMLQWFIYCDDKCIGLSAKECSLKDFLFQKVSPGKYPGLFYFYNCALQLKLTTYRLHKFSFAFSAQHFCVRNKK